MPGTMESGLSERTLDRVKDDKSGLMALCMKVGGRTTRLTVKEG